MQNEIEDIRCDVHKYFDKNNRLETGQKYKLSEGGLHYYTSERYVQNDPERNWIICKIEVWDIEANEKVIEYLTNGDDTDYCSHWIRKNGKDYLILPEACQGQSVLDIEERQLYSFYSSDDPFTWAHVYPSPDGNKIAVNGYYWSSPNELRVYDTHHLTQLPYRLIYHAGDFMCKDGCVFEQWEDNNTIILRKNGGCRVKINL